MPEAYDYVAKGEELAAVGRIADAERAFRQAIRIYEKAGDRDGVWYALGRWGAAYQANAEDDKAIDLYRQAFKLGTDIPATLHSLISLLTHRGELDEAFTVAASWDKRGYAQVGGTAFTVFIGLGQGLSREGRHEEATTLLTRTVDSIPAGRHPEIYWSALGALGQALERAERVSEAMRLWADAIAAGSTDRNTYTRHLINLEHQKEYETELAVIEQALRVQHDAAWELDLRKRQQRIQLKVGSIPKEEGKKTIPAFSIRSGEAAVTLIHQVKLPVQASSLAVSGDVAYMTTGGKSPALTALDTESAAQVWRVELPESVHGLLAAEGVVITYAQTGPVGTCETILRFYDQSGEQIATVRLPDATSQMMIADDLLYAGCRNGKLYAMTLQGEHRWSYTVPGSTDNVDSPYMRPCPYLVAAGKSLVVFSSWQNVYALNSRGQMAWHWTVPEHRTSSQAGGFTITISTGPDLVRSLAVAPDGSRVLVAAGETLYVLENDKVVLKLKPGESIDSAKFLGTPSDWIVGSGTTARIYNDGKQRARFDIPPNAQLAGAAPSEHIVASFDRLITVATPTGKRVAEIEFAKSVVGFGFGAGGQLIIGAGQLIILGISQKTTTTVQQSERRDATAGPIPAPRRRPSRRIRSAEENGFPVRWFEATKLGGSSGKALYQGRDDGGVTIEQLALEQYKQLGFEGLWSENDYWWTIMSLLYWDALFARLPEVFSPELGAFPGPLQDMPRDLFTGQFFSRRQDLIRRREVELRQGSMFGIRKPNPETDLRNSFARHQGMPCRSADWDRFSVDQLACSTKKLTPPQLCMLMRRLLEDFNNRRSGLPDLFLWRGDTPLFVEVKATNERLSDGQIAWMSFLAGEVQVPVELCRVTELDA